MQVQITGKTLTNIFTYIYIYITFISNWSEDFFNINYVCN